MARDGFFETAAEAVVNHRGVGLPLRPSRRMLPAEARGTNLSLICSLLFHHGPVSRADLARMSGLTRMSVSDLVAELIAAGLVVELGPDGRVRVGKPATLLGFRKAEVGVVALDLAEVGEIRGAIVDLGGAVRARAQLRVEPSAGGFTLDAIEGVARGLMDGADVTLLGVGVASPGVVDPDGTVIQSSNLGWRDVALSRELSARLGVAVHASNDANAAALAAFTYGDGAANAFMHVSVRHGVGAAIIIDGVLLRGHSFAAGEIGHITVDESGPPCGCGRRGCLEQYLALPVLRERLATADPEEARAIQDDVGVRLGTVLAPIVAALDLPLVMISGPADVYSDAMLERASATVRRFTLARTARRFELVRASNDEDGGLQGAAALVLIGELGFS